MKRKLIALAICVSVVLMAQLTKPNGGRGSAGTAGTDYATPFTPTTYALAAASPCGAAQNGQTARLTNSPLVGGCNGSIWQWWIDGFLATIPAAVSTWTQVNAGSATFDDTYGAIRIKAPAAAGDNWRILAKTAPATPWTMTVYMEVFNFSVDFPGIGIGFRQSSNGMLHHFGLQNAAVSYTNFRGFISRKYTDHDTSSTAYKTAESPLRSKYWLRIADNGTNRICSYSLNGQDFTEFHSIGRTDFLTADQYVLMVQSINTTYDAEAVYYSVKIE